MDNKNYEIVDSVEQLEKTIERVRKAQKIFSTYTQEQVDKIFRASALAVNKERIPLAKLAVEETGMGVIEDKVIKNHYASEYIYNKYRDAKTCGVIEDNKDYGTKRIAEPIGVVAAVIPTTNPTSTAIFKTLLALKTRNGIIISPHPRAKKSTIEAAKLVLEAAVKAGAPEDIISWIDVPSLEMTNLLMREADIILATGGPGMVRSAYSSGKPAIGVGAGNTPAIIDDSADIVLAVNSIIHSKTFDNGMICASEQSVVVLDGVYDKVKAEFSARGCYFLNDDEKDKVRKTILINGSLNAKIVGQSAYRIAELAGVTVPDGTKILIGEVESTDLSEEFVIEAKDKNAENTKADNFNVTRNGESFDSERYRQFYSFLISASAEEFALDAEIPDAEPLVSLEYTDSYMKKTVKIDFYENTTMTSLIAVDGKSKYICSKAYVDTLVDNIKKIETGEDYVTTWK